MLESMPTLREMLGSVMGVYKPINIVKMGKRSKPRRQ